MDLSLALPMPPHWAAFLPLQTTLFLLLWHVLHHHVLHHGALPFARPLILLNSWLYSLFSILLLLLILLSHGGPSPQSSESRGAADRLGRHLFHLSKFWEYLDILFLTATNTPITLSLAAHHLTTPYLTAARMWPDEYSEGWRLFGVLNAFHHALLYAYFGGAKGKGLREALLVTGTVQLRAGIVMEGWVVWRKVQRGMGEEVWPNLVAAAGRQVRRTSTSWDVAAKASSMRSRCSPCSG